MTTHISVLLEPAIHSLDIKPHDIVVDGTFGAGGHTARILESQHDVHVICVDLDEDAELRFKERFGYTTNVRFVHANFKEAARIMQEGNVTTVHKVLLDLGTSTFQLLDDTRGFSFKSDSPLSMAFSQAGSHTGFNAYDIVNEWEESSIADIIFGYGEERAARKIARTIVAARAHGPITTSGALADVIAAAIPRRGRIHPATKTFQALRIAVNDELGVIKQALDAWWEVLAPGGRISVITFHSLEDRIVKHWMIAQEHKRVITKKPIIPTDQELQDNPRSRSAKLRTIEKEVSL